MTRLAQFCIEIIDYHWHPDPHAYWPENPDRTTWAVTVRVASAVGARMVILSDPKEVEHFVGGRADSPSNPQG